MTWPEGSVNTSALQVYTTTRAVHCQSTPPTSFQGLPSACGSTTTSATPSAAPAATSTDAAAAAAAAADRKVSWWFDVGDSEKQDAGNLAAIAAHTSVFSRAMPYNSKVTLNGNVSLWWGHDSDVGAWNTPLQKMGVPVLPYLIDTSNSTEMHLVYANTSAVVADAVAIAEHYGFQGWFIDYEDETPPDTDPQKSEKLARFLTALGDALHAKNMSLTICVASWSGLLADYGTIANSSVDELMLMSTYSNPSNSQDIIKDYFAKIKAATGSLAKAGVGMGIYYDGQSKAYPKDWTEASARAFIKGMVDQGGSNIDIYRLSKGGDDWPHDDWWWTALSDFLTGNQSTHTATAATVATTTTPTTTTTTNTAAAVAAASLASVNITVSGPGVLRLDFGVERAGWFEFESPDLQDAVGGVAGVRVGLSEYDEPWPGKTRPVTIYADGVYRLETNPELYEGIRYVWIFNGNGGEDGEGSDTDRRRLNADSTDHKGGTAGLSTPSTPWHITAVRVVGQTRAVNYTGSFDSGGDKMIDTVWYSGAYGSKLNMMGSYVLL